VTVWVAKREPRGLNAVAKIELSNEKSNNTGKG